MDFKQVIAVGLLAASGTLLVTTNVKSQTIPAGLKNIVLVHGAFADGSSWAKVNQKKLPVLL